MEWNGIVKQAKPILAKRNRAKQFKHFRHEKRKDNQFQTKVILKQLRFS